jgi:TRF2-interacting telomeric protein/Rap1 - C terminal domain
MAVLMVELPEMKGVWTQMEDDILAQGDAKQMKILDKKHGRGAAIDRKIFITSWRKWSFESRWTDPS